MKQNVLLSELFPNFHLQEPFQTVLVRSAEVDRENRSIVLELDSEVYINPDMTEKQTAALKERYGLKVLQMHLHFPKSLLPEVPTHELLRVLCEAYSMAAGILAGAKWDVSEEQIDIHLLANGKEAMIISL